MKPSIVGLIWVMISIGLATVEATCPGKITSGPTPKAIPEPRTLSVHHSDYSGVDSKVVCTWLIQTALPRRVVKLTTMDFSPAGGPGCNSTFLAAFDGPSVGKHLLKRWCTPDEVVTSQGSSLTLRFESDNVTARTQFRVDYVAILPKDGDSKSDNTEFIRLLFSLMGMGLAMVMVVYFLCFAIPICLNFLHDSLIKCFRKLFTTQTGRTTDAATQEGHDASHRLAEPPPSYLSTQSTQEQTDPEVEGLNHHSPATADSRAALGRPSQPPAYHKERPPTYEEAVLELARAVGLELGGGTCAGDRFRVESANSQPQAEEEGPARGGEDVILTRL